MICGPRVWRDRDGWCADGVVQFVRNCVFCNTMEGTGRWTSFGEGREEGMTDLFIRAGEKRRKGPKSIPNGCTIYLLCSGYMSMGAERVRGERGEV